MGLFSRLLFEQVQSTGKLLISQHHLKSQERMKFSIIATTVALAALALPGSEAIDGITECEIIIKLNADIRNGCTDNFFTPHLPGHNDKACLPAIANGLDLQLKNYGGIQNIIEICEENM